MRSKFNAEVETLEKLEPIYSTIRRIRAIARERGIEGFRGLMIDFVKVSPLLYNCVDLVGKTRLFSLIVDDIETAKQILDINKEIKGAVINIFPLSLVD